MLVILTVFTLIFTQDWVGTWGTGPQLVESQNNPPSPGLAQNTLRQVVRVSIGGSTIRLRFSNAFSDQAVTLNTVTVAVSKGTSQIDTGSLKTLQFSGKESVTMAAKGEVYSDSLSFQLESNSLLAITIYFGSASSSVTGHPGSRTTSYITSGNHTADASINGGSSTEHWYVIESVDVQGGTGAVVVLGDSITDGRGSGTDKQNRWPDIMSQKMLSNGATRGLGVLNMGIGGNTVLSGGLGPTAIARFDRDVLSQAGVKYLMILEGVNDLGGGGDANSVATNLQNAFSDFITKAHAKNIKVIGCTLTPFGQSSYDTAARLKAADALNDWIRTSGKFDGVVDFYKIMGSSNPDVMQQSLQSGDYLHPNEAGHRAMGEGVDLSLFS